MSNALIKKLKERSLEAIRGPQVGPVLLAFFVLFIAVAVLYLRYAHHYKGIPGDFGVYLRAWERIKAGTNPYVLTDPSPYKYSPGILTLFQFLPSSAEQAWRTYCAFCLSLLGGVLFFGVRYRNYKTVGLLVLGLALSWKGILETLDYGQIEILIFSLAVVSGATIGVAPVLSGLIAGTLPWIKLPWVLFFIPLMLAANRRDLQPGPRMKWLFSGYLASMFAWGAAIPSITFGSEKSLKLSQSWLEILKHQPEGLFSSAINQSAWVSVQRWLEGSELLAYGITAVLLSLIMGLLISRPMRAHVHAYDGLGSLAWISPWMLLTQLMNPLSWRWGSVFVLGMPFAIAARISGQKIHWSRILMAVMALLAFILQLNPVVRELGLGHWTELHASGSVTFFWLVLMLMAL